MATGKILFEQSVPGVSSINLKKDLLIIGTLQGSITLWSVDGSFQMRAIAVGNGRPISQLEREENKILALIKDDQATRVLHYIFE